MALKFPSKHQDGSLGWDSVVLISAALPSLIVRVGSSQHSPRATSSSPYCFRLCIERASGGIPETNRREAAVFTFPRAISAKS